MQGTKLLLLASNCMISALLYLYCVRNPRKEEKMTFKSAAEQYSDHLDKKRFSVWVQIILAASFSPLIRSYQWQGCWEFFCLNFVASASLTLAHFLWHLRLLSSCTTGKIFSLIFSGSMMVGSWMAGPDAKLVLFQFYSIPAAVLVSVILTDSFVFTSLIAAAFGVCTWAFETGYMANNSAVLNVGEMSTDLTFAPFAVTTLVVGSYLSVKNSMVWTFRRIESIFAATAKMKDEFFACVSHEFKTPLNGIVGMTSLLEAERATLTKSQAERLEIISQCSSVLRLLVDNVLMQGKSADVQTSKVKPREVFEQATNVIQSLGDPVVILKVNENVPEYLVLSETCLVQVLLNLGSNAMKFSPSDRKCVVYVDVDMVGDTILQVEVADEGRGISQKFVEERLFKMYQRESKNCEIGGTGLGLCISKKICEEMGGTIAYRPNEKGHGSVFQVRLPVTRNLSNLDLKLLTPQKRPAVEYTPEIMRIMERASDSSGIPNRVEEETDLGETSFSCLVCEDNHVNLLVLRGMLARLQVPSERIYEVTDGGKAVEWLLDAARNKPEVLKSPILVLCDLQMPILNGADVVKLWRQMLPMLAPQAQIRFVCVTAAGKDGLVKQSDVFQEADILPKPIKFSALQAIIDEMAL